MEFFKGLGLLLALLFVSGCAWLLAEVVLYLIP